MTARETAKQIAELIQDKKGKQTVLLDIADLSSFADYFVVTTGESNIQVKAIADHIEAELKKEGLQVYHKEGYQYQNWILLDYIDVVVHIFNPESREFYGIERLWADSKMEFIADE